MVQINIKKTYIVVFPGNMMSMIGDRVKTFHMHYTSNTWNKENECESEHW